MSFDLKQPCKMCPFRNDGKGIRLNHDRALEILDAITTHDLSFHCHETLDYDSSEDGEGMLTDKTQHCAGAMILLEKLDNPNQMMRIAERIGVYDRRKLKMDSPVFDDEDEDGFLDYHND